MRALLLIPMLFGCRPPAGIGGYQPFDPNAVDLPEDYVIYGFSWVEDDVLGAMPRPDEDDLVALRSEGVDLLVTLTETELDPAMLSRVGIETVHIPIPDYEAPTPEQADLFVSTVEARRATGQQVTAHCLAGRGRTGTMTAIWFVAQGMTAVDAIAHTRALRPGSIETVEQEQAVFDYEARQ